MGVCNGFAIPVAQRVGANDPVRMRRYVANAAYLSALFALVLTVATGLLCRAILTVMQTPADIFDGAYIYIFIIFMASPPPSSTTCWRGSSAPWGTAGRRCTSWPCPRC